MQSNEDQVDTVLDGIEKSSSPEQFSAGLEVLAKLIQKYLLSYSALLPILSSLSTGM